MIEALKTTCCAHAKEAAGLRGEAPDQGAGARLRSAILRHAAVGCGGQSGGGHGTARGAFWLWPAAVVLSVEREAAITPPAATKMKAIQNLLSIAPPPKLLQRRRSREVSVMS